MRAQLGRRLPGFLALIAIVLAGLVVAGLVVRKVARPFILCYGESRGINDTDRELQTLQADNIRLRAQRDYLASSQGAMVEARKQGWVRPGERSIVIEDHSGGIQQSDERKQGFFAKIRKRFER